MAAITRTCAYDRANLGHSDPAPGPRGLPELVADLEHVISAAEIPGPYVLVGTSGGGYITAGYAFAHPRQIAGLVFVEVPSPFRDPPAPVVRDTRWNSPVNIEKRDYLQVEKDAWSARERVGDIPMTVISNEYSAEEIAVAEFASERRGMRSNVAGPTGMAGPQSASQADRWCTRATPSRRPTPTLVTNAILEVVRPPAAADGLTVARGRPRHSCTEWAGRRHRVRIAPRARASCIRNAAPPTYGSTDLLTV